MTVNQKRKKKRTLKACTNVCTEKHSIGGDISIGVCNFCANISRIEGVWRILLAEEGWTFQSILKHIGGVHQGGEKAKKKMQGAKRNNDRMLWPGRFCLLNRRLQKLGQGGHWPGGSGQWNKPDSRWNVGQNKKKEYLKSILQDS